MGVADVARLYRPHIPVEVKCRVAMRQLGELWPDEALKANAGGHGAFLDRLLFKLAELLGCEVKDLRLDHDPPLAWRPWFRRGLGKKTYYEPAANDPHHLFYRPHGPQFAASHLIKTNVRGDHGQHPDRVLIKKEKRRQKKLVPARSAVVSHGKLGRGRVRHGKTKWPKRQLQSRNDLRRKR
jgi:hypothetical protein